VPPEANEGDDEETWIAANANLVSSLQECNRRLANAGAARAVPPPSASPSPRPLASARRERGGERGASPSERFARDGALPYSMPCIRDTPFTPSQRQLDRLGLAPADATTLRDAYAKSNERMLAQLKPLCAGVLGNDKLPDRVGPSACVSAIVDGARKENPDKMQEALARVAEVGSGKRPAPGPDAKLEPIEALMLAMSAESKAFESDVAASLGPEDARRVASRLCTDRGTARAKPAAPQ